MPAPRHVHSTTDLDRTLKLARRRQGVCASELAEHEVHRQALGRHIAAGTLERVGRGLYRTPASPLTEHHVPALGGAAFPRGVVCLLSALRFHGIGTQLPSQVWIAADRRARQPALSYPPRR